MNSYIKTIFETMCLVCLRWANNCRRIFAGRTITCCGLWSAGSLILQYDNGAVICLLVSAVFFDLGSQHLFSKNLHGAISVMPVGFTLLSFNVVQYFFKNGNVASCKLKGRQIATAVCKFTGDTLLGSLGAEIEGLRGIIQPAIGFIQLFVKDITQQVMVSNYIR